MGFRNPLVPQQVADFEWSRTIGTGGTDTVDVTAPHGWLWRCVGMYFIAFPPASASPTTGDFTVVVRSTASSFTQQINHLEGVGPFGESVTFNYGHFSVASGDQKPSDVVAQGLIVGRLVVDSSRALSFQCVNTTDDDATFEGTLLFDAIRVEEPN